MHRVTRYIVIYQIFRGKTYMKHSVVSKKIISLKKKIYNLYDIKTYFILIIHRL